MQCSKQNKRNNWSYARVRKLDEIRSRFYNEPWQVITNKLNSKMKTNFSRSAVYRAAEYYSIVDSSRNVRV